jgi:hypothetical protein
VGLICQCLVLTAQAIRGKSRPIFDDDFRNQQFSAELADKCGLGKHPIGFEAITFAITIPGKDVKLKRHVDTKNDTRPHYTVCSTWSVIVKSTDNQPVHLSVIGYTRSVRANHFVMFYIPCVIVRLSDPKLFILFLTPHLFYRHFSE